MPVPVIGEQNGGFPVRAGEGDLVNQVLGQRGLLHGQQPGGGGEQRIGEPGIAHVHAIVAGPAEIGIAGGGHVAAQIQRHLRAVLIAHLRRGAGRVQPHVRKMPGHLGLVFGYDAGHHQLGHSLEHGFFLIIAHGQPLSAAFQHKVAVLHAQGIAVPLFLRDHNAVQLGGIAQVKSARLRPRLKGQGGFGGKARFDGGQQEKKRRRGKRHAHTCQNQQKARAGTALRAFFEGMLHGIPP